MIAVGGVSGDADKNQVPIRGEEGMCSGPTRGEEGACSGPTRGEEGVSRFYAGLILVPGRVEPVN